MELPEGSTVAYLLEYYKVSPEKAHFLVVNRRKAKLNTTLKDGDEVRVIPRAAGG
jgi:molybdopterin converting factor small subunit